MSHGMISLEHFDLCSFYWFRKSNAKQFATNQSWPPVAALGLQMNRKLMSSRIKQALLNGLCKLTATP
jgi:hypothetical protein